MKAPVVIPEALKRAQWLANITDTAVRVPVLGIRFGLDFLLGLLPFLGDLLTLAIGMGIWRSARKMQAPKGIQRAIIRNLLIDFVVGLMPFIGDIFDLFYKANVRNVRLLERWWLSEHAGQLGQATQAQLNQWQARQEKQ